MLNCPSVHSSLQLWSKGAQLQLKLVACLGIICDAGFAGMKNARVLELRRLTSRFQKKAWEVKPCMAGLNTCRQPLKG
jgi:hypothetical protein